MKNMETLNLYTTEDLLNENIGIVGTPERDKFDAAVAEEIKAYHVGEAIRKAREAKKLTQEQLGERIGVHRAQVCRLESGKSITLASMMKVFNALGVQVTLDMKGIGRVAL